MAVWNTPEMVILVIILAVCLEIAYSVRRIFLLEKKIVSLEKSILRMDKKVAYKKKKK